MLSAALDFVTLTVRIFRGGLGLQFFSQCSFFMIIPQNEEVILALMATNLFQRCLEFIFALPPNVYWGVVISNLDTEKGCCVRDGWKSAAADDTYGYDYA